MLYTLLIKQGDQYSIEHIEESGSYFDMSLVLWDERKGPLPDDLQADYSLALRQQAERKETSAKKESAIRLLASTDWYIIRHVETGRAIPLDVLEKRKEARLILP